MNARRMLHVVTAFAVAAAVVVTIVTGSDQRSGAIRVATSLPLQWASTAIPAAAPSTIAPDTTTTTLPPPIMTEAPPTTDAPPSTAPPSAPAAVDVPVDADPQLVATLASPDVQVYDEPGSVQATLALPAETWFGNPTVLPVVQRGAGWLKVLLPVRPNGSQGWIRERDATLSYVVDRVRVDLAGRRLIWWRNGQVMVDTSVAVGAPNSPTPSGSFFVTDLVPEASSSAYGSWILALDGHSEVFDTFDGGDARIAIHGTNDPSSIGQATSSGCVRVDADALSRLAASLPLGTPVEID